MNKIIVQGHIGLDGSFMIDKESHIDLDGNIVVDNDRNPETNLLKDDPSVSEFLCNMTGMIFSSNDKIVSKYHTFKITIEKPE